MKIKNLTLFILLSIFIFSCNREDNPTIITKNNPLITSINSNFLFPNTNLNSVHQAVFHFDYDNNKRLSKKIGGYLPVSLGTGFNGVFSNLIYTTLTYEDYKVTVEDFSNSSEFTVPKKSKYFTLNKSNQIILKEVPNKNTYNTKKIIYSYKNNLLDEIKTTLPNMFYDPTDPADYILTYSEKFFYDANKNLIRTEYNELRNGMKAGYEIVRLFENYDNSYNPCKKLALLDEFFYRSISINNFRSFTQIEYMNGQVSNSNTSQWTFTYDTNGNIIFN